MKNINDRYVDEYVNEYREGGCDDASNVSTSSTIIQ